MKQYFFFSQSILIVFISALYQARSIEYFRYYCSYSLVTRVPKRERNLSRKHQLHLYRERCSVVYSVFVFNWIFL